MKIDPNSELAAASEIQALLLPKNLPHLPGADIAGQSIPAGAMGGDYFDAIAITSETLFLTIADVMGKGLRAALLMLSLRSVFRSVLRYQEDHGKIMEHLNLVAGEDLRCAGSFATFCLLSFRRDSGCLACSNAGHYPPLIYSRGQITYLGHRGAAVGLLANGPVPPVQTRMLVPGDTVVLYTDGLLEAQNAAGEKFGRSRLEEAVKKSASLPAAGIRDAILASLASFTCGYEQRDDVTLVILRVQEEGGDFGDQEKASR